MTEEAPYQSIHSTNSTYEPEEIQPHIEKPTTKSTPLVPSSSIHQQHRVFAPLNTPFYRRRQTLTILVWWLFPWICLYIALLCLRSNNRYIFYGMLAYITWMALFRNFTRRGGLRQQWLRRLAW